MSRRKLAGNCHDILYKMEGRGRLFGSEVLTTKHDMASKLLLSTWENLADDANNVSEIMLMFGREEIERGLICDVLDRLKILSESAAFADKFEGTVHVYVDGYNHDHRELYEIEEVVKFFRDLTQKWPFWLHFAAKPDSFFVVLQLLCDTECIRQKGKVVASKFMDKDQFNSTLLSLVRGAGSLYETHSFPSARFDSLISQLEALLDRVE